MEDGHDIGYIGDMESAANRAANDALWSSMIGWTSIILIPGFLLVLGLIWVVAPSHKPPSQAWANGTYVNGCCSAVVLRDGVLTASGKSTRYTVSEDKFGNMIELPAGIGVRRGNVEFGGTFVFVHFNEDSMAMPAIGRAKSIHLNGLDDNIDYVFTRRD